MSIIIPVNHFVEAKENVEGATWCSLNGERHKQSRIIPDDSLVNALCLKQAEHSLAIADVTAVMLLSKELMAYGDNGIDNEFVEEASKRGTRQNAAVKEHVGKVRKYMSGTSGWQRSKATRSLMRFYDDIEKFANHKSQDDLQFFSTLEALSDMNLHSTGKYMGSTKMIAAKVIVFTNAPPPTNSLPGRIVECKAVDDLALASTPFDSIDVT
jgi:hypothetical protein